ncbi:hypothetical protein TNCV_180281 [Trichonephila clavipes]|nr:hypothetical protein TNCV_180281 [Trichonephila clavipes]
MAPRLLRVKGTVLFARPGSPMKEGYDLSTFYSENEYLSHHAKTIVVACWLLLVYIDITLPQKHTVLIHKKSKAILDITREGRESVEVDESSGRSQTSNTAENIEKVSAENIARTAHLFQYRRFQFADEIKSALQTELKETCLNRFQNYFDDFYKRLQNCVVAQDTYFEGGYVSAI